MYIYSQNEMTHEIEPNKVLDYIRKSMQPVRCDLLTSKFCGSKSTKETQKALKNRLRDVLLSELILGNLMHYNDYFYTTNMAEEIQESMDQMEELPSDWSQISFSSCESIA
ncbi:hypothetical protein KR215_007316, partial [Drosophila sulfurigaster]